MASLVGFFFGGGLSIRETADAFVEANRTTKFTSQYHMQGEMNTAVLRQFLLRGSRWGWRVGLFAGSFK